MLWAAAAGALLLGARYALQTTRTRVVSVCVATDYDYRVRKPDWETSLQPMFDEVNRLFADTGVQWRLIRGGESYPPQSEAGLQERAELLHQYGTCKADVILGLTGYSDRAAEAVATPFSHYALVTETAADANASARVVARTLAKLFGVPGPVHAMLISLRAVNDVFDSSDIHLIHALRNYDFARGASALEGAWERKAASALAEELSGRVANPAAEAHRVLGHAFAQNLLYQPAVGEMRQAVAAAPDDIRLHLELAMDLKNNSDPQAAIEELKAVAKQDPGDARPHALVGAMYLNAQRVDEAIDELRIATQLDPRNAGYATAYGVALSRQPGRSRQASAAFQHAVDLKPTEPGAFVGLQEQDESEREAKAEAARLAEEARRAPGSADAQLRVGLAYGFAGDLDQAQREIQRALQIEPGNGSAHLAMARLLYLKGEYPAADQQLKAAVSAGTMPRHDFESNLKRRLASLSN